MNEHILSGWKRGWGQSPQLRDERTDFDGMGEGVWGLNPQLQDESQPVRLGRSGKQYKMMKE
jgi:hypothetical protein